MEVILPRPTNQIRQLALIGAKARVGELEAELATLRRTFPELRQMRGMALGSGSLATPAIGQVNDAAPRRSRRRMSAEARARIAAAQRKRWAALKAGTKKQNG